MTNTTPTIREQVRKTADRIWNAGAKLTHNDLDEILTEFSTLTQQETREKILAALPERDVRELDTDLAQWFQVGWNEYEKLGRETITNLPLTDS